MKSISFNALSSQNFDSVPPDTFVLKTHSSDTKHITGFGLKALSILSVLNFIFLMLLV